MLNLVQTLDHAYATAARDMVNTMHFVRDKVEPALRAIVADEKVIQEVTKLVDPAAENIERSAFAIFGMFIKVIDELPDSNGAATVTVPAEIIADIKSVASAIKAKVHPSLAAAPAAAPVATA